mmetsp:Transcript_11085/g.16629  ORF Transcript_11085/g.16629 Transcript_11085/m.16629 type:complete len:224 (-) Transcript_11085:379-1050(-)
MPNKLPPLWLVNVESTHLMNLTNQMNGLMCSMIPPITSVPPQINFNMTLSCIIAHVLCMDILMFYVLVLFIKHHWSTLKCTFWTRTLMFFSGMVVHLDNRCVAWPKIGANNLLTFYVMNVTILISFWKKSMLDKRTNTLHNIVMHGAKRNHSHNIQLILCYCQSKSVESMIKKFTKKIGLKPKNVVNKMHSMPFDVCVKQLHLHLLLLLLLQLYNSVPMVNLS